MIFEECFAVLHLLLVQWYIYPSTITHPKDGGQSAP